MQLINTKDYLIVFKVIIVNSKMERMFLKLSNLSYRFFRKLFNNPISSRHQELRSSQNKIHASLISILLFNFRKMTINHRNYHKRANK